MKLNSKSLILICLAMSLLSIKASSKTKFIKKNLIAKPILCLSVYQFIYGCKTLKQYNENDSNAYYKKNAKEYFSHFLSTAIVFYLIHENL